MRADLYRGRGDVGVEQAGDHREPCGQPPGSPVYLNGEVVQGVELPEDVALAPIPGSEYDYAYVNNVPALVEPMIRRVEYMYR